MSEADNDYPIVVVPLSSEDGGGFAAYAPDLYGCMSDGETPEEAARNIKDAILEWRDEAERLGRPVPKPGSAAQAYEEQRRELLRVVQKQDKLLANQGAAIDSLQAEFERLSRRVSALLQQGAEAAPPIPWGVGVLASVGRSSLDRPDDAGDGEKAH